MYEIRHNNGHYELYVYGKFYCSYSDDMIGFNEAAREIDRIRFKEEAPWVYAMSAVNQLG